MELYLEEIAELETNYVDLCKPRYKERVNVVTGRLDADIERIHKEVGSEKE